MPGDYSRISDQPHSRFSALFMQQGRVQLDADWNESVEILRRRIREEANDVFGHAAVPRATTPNGFQLAWTGTGTGANITISPGRIYVDGVLAEYFADEKFSYLTQPFLPNPPALSSFNGQNVLVYLDVWEREITSLEDASIVDPALNGVDTGTRLKTVWQVKVMAAPGGGAASCVSDFSSLFPPSGGRLTTSTNPGTAAANPCELPVTGGYQGVDNRLYRLQVHDATNLLVKWSRDNGSVATGVTAMNNPASGSIISVVSTGADDDLSFEVGDWVEVTDDAHELSGQAGMMAKVTGVNTAGPPTPVPNLTLDRSLASGSFNPAGGTVRVRRWDQTTGLSGSSGLIQITPGTPFTIENAIQAKIDIVSGGALKVGDAWVFAARVATANVDVLSAAPPIAINHHYASLGTFSGVGGASPPTFTDCRVLWPPAGQGDDCACTVCVDAAAHNAGTATIQQAINQVIQAGGGVVCLGPGTFNVSAALNVTSANAVTIRGTGSSTIISSTAQTGIAVLGSSWVTIADLTVTCAPAQAAGAIVAVGLTNCLLCDVERCTLTVTTPGGNDGAFGVGVGMAGFLADVTIRLNAMVAEYGVLVLDVQSDQEKGLTPAGAKYVGRLAVANLQIEENLVYASLWGIAMGGQMAAEAVLFARNIISSASGGIGFYGAAITPVVVTGNMLSVGVTGIEMGCDDFALTDNVVEKGSAGTGTLVGITVGAAPSEGQIRGAIERNRIAEFVGGVAIAVSADASRLTIRDNTIDEVDGGIILADTATVDDLLIEGNEVTNVGATSTTTSLENGFAGIVVIGATRAVVRGNTLTNIGTANTQGVGVMGIGVSKPTALSVVDNELRNVGSLSITTALTYGIRVIGPFDDARVVGNRVEPSLPTAATGTTLVFTGVSITNPRRGYYPGLSGAELDLAQNFVVATPAIAPAAAPAVAPAAAPAAAPAVAPAAAPPAAILNVVQSSVSPLVFQLNSTTSTAAEQSATTARKALSSLVGDQAFSAAGDSAVIASANQQSADISGNVVDVAPSIRPLVEADIVGSCLLRANRASLLSASSSATPMKFAGTTMPVSTISAYATVLIASDNFVNAYAGVTGLALTGTAKATVLGNISTSGITLGGSALAGPWNTLNGV